LLVFPEHASPAEEIRVLDFGGVSLYPPLLGGLVPEDTPIGSPPIARFTWEPKFLGTGSATIYVVALTYKQLRV